ncbi:hypothetical protein TUM20983_27870 [Mycobacterium antarcticum]|uniref:hypothetical protein n=1 Tax=unclassified Mycolicibacterium TaxID=2636767 RepID=UPI0023940CB4|nr:MULTISPECIES: hypothetical protein [unclassified Mycolicibacterium]GLP75677.1 hypothetical protein TUM20983_27870 [Mycolicibacterium sp. TUM20983]GLP83976.1 hypothetical protein TUM20984_53960 [Mycolicibacterium sp. TUM20984]
MINTGQYTDQLVERALDALDNPDTVDTNTLLLAATDFLDFLDGIPPTTSHLIPHARALANAAADWAVFQRDQSVLRDCFRVCFAAYSAA